MQPEVLVHSGWLHKKSGGKAEQEVRTDVALLPMDSEVVFLSLFCLRRAPQASLSKSLGQRRNKWDRRYFVILPSANGGYMRYYKQEEDFDK